MSLRESWEKTYSEIYQQLEDSLIRLTREEQQTKLSLVSSKNKSFFEQLLDIQDAFAKYMQSETSFTLSIIGDRMLWILGSWGVRGKAMRFSPDLSKIS